MKTHITFSKDKEPMHRSTDASYGCDRDRGRSTTRYIFRYANGPISWMLKLQLLVALSIQMATMNTYKEAVRLQGLMGEIGINSTDK